MQGLNAVLSERDEKGDSEHASLSDVLCPNKGTCTDSIASQWGVCNEKEVRERRDIERGRKGGMESRGRGKEKGTIFFSFCAPHFQARSYLNYSK